MHILSSDVDIMRVEIPLKALSYKISLPLAICIANYHDLPAGSLHALQERIVSSILKV